MDRRRNAWTSALFFVSTGTFAFAGNVITVDDSGPAHFAQIQLAVDAAVDGDTILVQPGNYAGFTIDGKAVTVVGDEGALPVVSGRIWIKNTTAGSALTVAHLRAQGMHTPASSRTALVIEDCAGAVRIVGCELNGAHGSGSAGRTGVQLDAATDVAFANCVVAGGRGHWDPSACSGPSGPGGAGFASQSSMIAVYDSDIRGGRGGTSTDVSFSGGISVELSPDPQIPELFFVSGSFIEGGDAGPTVCLFEEPWGGNGGHGIAMGDDPLTVHLLDNVVLGGSPTWGGPKGGAVSGTAGSPVVGGPPFQYVVPSLEFTIPAVAREGTFVTVRFNGTPGSHVFLNDELTTTFALVPSWRGVLISPFPSAAGPTRARRWGVIPASGILKAIYRAPTLPAGVEAQTRFLQAYRVGASGLTLGSFATLTVLDSSF